VEGKGINMNMCNYFKKLFTEHPESVDETYLQHMWFAVRYALQLGVCTMVAIIHSVFPFLFTDYCSKKIAYLNSWVEKRN